MYRSILFKPLGIRLKDMIVVGVLRNKRDRRVDIRIYQRYSSMSLGEIHVENVLDRYYLESE